MTIRIDHYPAGVYSFTHVSSLTAHESSSFKRMSDEDNHQGTYLTTPTLVRGIAYLSMYPKRESRRGFRSGLRRCMDGKTSPPRRMELHLSRPCYMVCISSSNGTKPNRRSKLPKRILDHYRGELVGQTG